MGAFWQWSCLRQRCSAVLLQGWSWWKPQCEAAASLGGGALWFSPFSLPWQDRIVLFSVMLQQGHSQRKPWGALARLDHVLSKSIHGYKWAASVSWHLVALSLPFLPNDKVAAIPWIGLDLWKSKYVECFKAKDGLGCHCCCPQPSMCVSWGRPIHVAVPKDVWNDAVVLTWGCWC